MEAVEAKYEEMAGFKANSPRVLNSLFEKLSPQQQEEVNRYMENLLHSKIKKYLSKPQRKRRAKTVPDYPQDIDSVGLPPKKGNT